MTSSLYPKIRGVIYRILFQEFFLSYIMAEETRREFLVYITTVEAAELLGISPQQVIRRIKRPRSKKNRIQAKKFGGIWMVLKTSVERTR